MGPTLDGGPRKWAAGVGILLLTLVSTQLGGQEVTGGIRGRVREAGGAPAPGVEVIASGPQLLWERRSVSDASGAFSMESLRPGEYVLTLRRIGNRPVILERVRVTLGRTTFLDPVVLPAMTAKLEAVRITADRYTIEPARTDAGASLDAREYAALPIDRDYTAVMALLSHVSESHRGDPLNVAGATGLENLYFIDGVDVTTPLRGDRGTALPHNFVRAVDVKTGGFDAQYGGALGAIVNAVTYAGSNTFEAEVFGFGTTSGLAARPKAEPTLRERTASSFDAGVRVGGPLRRDRLWYSAAYNPRRATADREITGHGTFTDRRTAHVFATKLSLRAPAATEVELSFFGDPTTHDVVEQPGFLAGRTPLSPDAYLRRRNSGGTVGALRVVSSPAGGIVEAVLSRATGRDDELPRTEAGWTAPAFTDMVSGTISGGMGYRWRADAQRHSASVRAGWSFPYADVVAGVKYEDVSSYRAITQSGGYVLRRLASGDYLAYTEYSPPGRYHNRVPSVFQQVAFRPIPGVTGTIGLRWSRQTLTGASGDVAQRLGAEWQPRASIVWMPDDRGEQRLFASYGRYYQREPLNLSTVWYVDYLERYVYYQDNPLDGAATPDSSAEFATSEAQAPRHISDLQAEHSDELTIGYERRLWQRALLTTRFVRRELRSSFQWGLNGDGEWAMGTPGEGAMAFLPEPVREYTALQVAIDGEAGALRYRGSYVLSRNRGNYTGLFDTDRGFGFPGAVSMFNAPEHAVNTTGPLPNDRTHVVKVSGGYRAASGLSGGAVFTWMSGAPLNVLGLSNYYRPILLEPRGSAGRGPSLWDLSVRLAYEPRRTALPRVMLDVMHLGNPQRPTWLDQRRYLDPARTVANPAYLVPQSFQPPMMIRLGAEARL